MNNIVPKLCCLFCALGLWLLVSGESDVQYEKTFNGIPVEIHNTESLNDKGLSIIGGENYVVNITVKGNRSKLASVNTNEMKARADVGGISEAGEHSVDISVTPPADSGFTVIKQSISSIYVSVDTIGEKSFSIEVNPVAYYGEDFTINKDVVSPKSITVEGPMELLGSIKKARVDLDLGYLTNDVNYKSRIILLDEDGKEISSSSITLSHQYAEGVIKLLDKTEASQQDEKEVELRYNFKYGYFNDKNCSVSIFPAKVTLKGTKKDLANVDHIDVCTIDETVITSSTVFEAAIEAPNGTTLSSEQSAVVTVIVSEDISSLEVVMNSVEFTEMPDSLSAEMDGAYILTLIGRTADLNSIKQMIDDGEYPFTVSVNTSLIKTEGTYDLPVLVEFDNEFKKVWCKATQVGVKVS